MNKAITDLKVSALIILVLTTIFLLILSAAWLAFWAFYLFFTTLP